MPRAPDWVAAMVKGHVAVWLEIAREREFARVQQLIRLLLDSLHIGPESSGAPGRPPD